MLLIDRPIFHRDGRRFAHLISDLSLDELHDGARRLGLDRSFHRDHYDIPEEYVGEVLAAGVHQVDPREIVHALRRAGLRASRLQR
ncbi:DUF4031 domain-containing protein [Ferrimicrobium acidiphilum]|uniref:DUF4031 domain-containing protein n=1 Tax=Ferrimicrobium acidiphilum DSM 19497 TaxID=1121877 RepID=A0A0D8FY63_9ACTN|nr:DUF4031 domain-containing protein [Ferrimicrobium acidiphilum]KJE77909.1 hypothetical protein FEAC_02810 [Ferrimicrobium acidiphilum DSM 19497]MCL5053710.1 DUF4031 domain-containing protein [Gammaproteobacteria bacterium]